MNIRKLTDAERELSKWLKSVNFQEIELKIKSLMEIQNKSTELIESVDESIFKEKSKLINCKNERIEMIRKIDNPVIESIFNYYYICNYTWSEVAEKTSYSEATIKRYHIQGLAKLVKILKNSNN